MKEVIATFDDIAERLEFLGMIKEAEDVDVISNTIESAYSPNTVYPAKHPYNVIPSPRDLNTPSLDDVIMEHRDKAQVPIDSIKNALDQFERILDSVAAKVPKLKMSVEKYKKGVREMKEDVEFRLKNLLLYLLTEMGGKDTMTSSIEHMRLAKKEQG
jgi:peptidoglycan hydrolase CwlO-like protein